MAAVTSAVVAAGGLALSGMQYIKQRQDMNEAEAASEQAAQDFSSIEYINARKGQQVATLGTKLAQQEQARAVNESMKVIQQQGPEGAFQVTDVVDASNTANLKLAAGLDKEQARINELIAKQEQKNIDQKSKDQRDLAEARLTGAGEARAQALEGSRAAAEDIATGVGGLGTSLYAAQGLYNLDGSQINLG